MKAFDKDGNEIEVFSQEELEAKLNEVKSSALKEAEAKIEQERKNAEEAAAAARAAGDEVPEWAKEIIARVDSLSQSHTQTYVERVANGLDGDKRKLIEAKFSTLTGYDDTPEGLSRRAEDAYLLATGEKFNAGSVNVANLAAAGGGRSNVQEKAQSDVDAGIQAALGIRPEDVAKFKK